MRLLQVLVAFVLLAGWRDRIRLTHAWRGGGSDPLKQDALFESLPPTLRAALGAIRVALAGLLLLGLAIPELVAPVAAGVSLLMAALVVTSVRRGDPGDRAMPALLVLTGAIALVFLGL